MSNLLKLAMAMMASLTIVDGVAAQPAELKPLDLPANSGLSTVYRSHFAPWAEEARDRAKAREEARRTYWAEEAKRIASSGQNVVRDDDELYVPLHAPNFPRVVVLRSLWTLDPAASYLYESYDDAAHFHIVRVGGSDYPTLLFISARTGLIYESIGTGAPVYSPDKSRFFSVGLGGMGCGGEGFTVYRFDSEKVFLEAQTTMSCEGPCTHAWSGSNEIKSECAPSDRARIAYRLSYRDGTWHRTRSP